MGDQTLTFEEIIDQITPEIYEELKQVVASGKWLDGRKLTAQQIDHCLQALIAYESRYVDELNQTGVIEVKKDGACSSQLKEEDNKSASTFARFKT